MTKRLTIALVALAMFVLVAVMPVSADYSANTLYYVVAPNTSQGATVFIGEQGLNVAGSLAGAEYLAAPQSPPQTYLSEINGQSGNTSIGWWASASQITTTSPGQVINLQPSITSFQVPSTLSAYTGPWYLLNNTNQKAVINVSTGNPITVLTVADPSLDIAVYDPVNQVDDTGKSVVQGTTLGFKISTNMYNALASSRAPVNNKPGTGQNTDGYIDIRVKDTTGALITSLYNNSVNNNGALETLSALNVSTPTWIWGSAPGSVAGYQAAGPLGNWTTSATDVNGQQAYPAGTYTVYAQSKLNNMKDNYPNAGAAYTGKTITQSYTVTLTSNTVKIQANKDTVVRSKPFSVTVTGKPNTIYHLWVTGTSAMDGSYDNQPPMIALGQSGVKFDSYDHNASVAAGYTVNAGVTDLNATSYVYQNGAGNVIANDISPGTFANAIYLAANITTTASDGTLTVGWTTTNWTKAQKYTIRVEQNFSGQFKSDTVDVTVQKGAVTVTAAGSQSYYLGEEVALSGTNTESYQTFLFIIGPNLNANGAKLSAPRTAITNGDPTTFIEADVAGDNTWSYKWGTQAIELDAGTYTIYAVSQPVDNAPSHLANVAYGTVSIIIKKPFISATASQSTVAQGDNIFVTGTAQGNPSPGIAIWVLGKNYAIYTTEAVNADATFSHEIKKATTKTLAAGQYFVVAQHPMQNNKFDIVPADGTGAVLGSLSASGADNFVRNLQLNTGVNVFKITGSGSLQGSDAAEALVEAINDPNVDDTYTKLQFLIEVPYIRVDAVGDKHVGDKFTITAATNLAVDDDVLVQIYSSSFKPTQKSQSGEFSGATGTVKVVKGDSGANKISFDVDSSTFKPDEYIVQMDAVLQTATGTALFNVLEAAPPTAVPTAVVTTAAPTMVATTIPPTAVPTPIPTTKSPGYGALIALIGLGAVAFIVVRRH